MDLTSLKILFVPMMQILLCVVITTLFKMAMHVPKKKDGFGLTRMQLQLRQMHFGYFAPMQGQGKTVQPCSGRRWARFW